MFKGKKEKDVDELLKDYIGQKEELDAKMRKMYKKQSGEKGKRKERSSRKRERPEEVIESGRPTVRRDIGGLKVTDPENNEIINLANEPMHSFKPFGDSSDPYDSGIQQGNQYFEKRSQNQEDRLKNSICNQLPLKDQNIEFCSPDDRCMGYAPKDNKSCDVRLGASSLDKLSGLNEVVVTNPIPQRPSPLVQNNLQETQYFPNPQKLTKPPRAPIPQKLQSEYISVDPNTQTGPFTQQGYQKIDPRQFQPNFQKSKKFENPLKKSQLENIPNLANKADPRVSSPQQTNPQVPDSDRQVFKVKEKNRQLQQTPEENIKKGINEDRLGSNYKFIQNLKLKEAFQTPNENGNF